MEYATQTIYVFAARYAHRRNTGAAWRVVSELKIVWPLLSEHTRDQIVNESREARYCPQDWEALREFAARYNANSDASQDEEEL